ncbi:MAG: metalloregulator ArsR/SmtB family transcription factor [Acetobacteraceae bacterium]
MESSTAAHIFAALSQESRLGVLQRLIGAGSAGLPAGEIATALGLPASTTSFHLAALERAGLIQSTRRGRQIIYAVRVAPLRDLLAFLTRACCAGGPEPFEPIPEDPRTMTPAFNVLFLCTRNSARSIMAEAILTSLAPGRFHAWSAGSAPAGEPMPEVIAKLRALGHDVSGLYAKSWDVFTRPDSPRMDFVIALCDVLEGQTCPDFGNTAVTAAWPLPDPAKYTGSPAEQSALLNELYAGLRRRLDIFISLPFAALDRMALRARLDELAGGSLPALAGGR